MGVEVRNLTKKVQEFANLLAYEGFCNKAKQLGGGGNYEAINFGATQIPKDKTVGALCDECNNST